MMKRGEISLKEYILIVEDEIEIQSILKELLLDAGYQVDTASDGLEGITAFRQKTYDLILLDLMLPKIDGYAVREMIRKESEVPVLMITALDEEDDQVKGFEVLADDYITKPFSLKLVLKRVEALLRRRGSVIDEGEKQVFCYREIQLDITGMQVHVSGKEVALTKLELDLLHLFMRNQGRVFTRDELLNLVWGYDYTGYEKAVNIHIMNLRWKLGVDYIEAVRGVGYRFAKKD